MGPLQPLPIPDQVWDDITMDFIKGMPKSKGYSAILVVVDRLTKYAHFVAQKHPFTVVTIANIFIQEVVRLHGIPQSIISDHDLIFYEFFLEGIIFVTRIRTSPKLGLPSTNRQANRGSQSRAGDIPMLLCI